MAEIEIERRPRRSPWTWVALLLVLIAVAVGAWLVFGNGVQSGDGLPAAETSIEEPFQEPVEPVETAPAVPDQGGEVGNGEPAAAGAGDNGAGPDVDPSEGLDPAR
jgi:hypothetical protein